MVYRRDFLRWALTIPTASALLSNIASANSLHYQLKSIPDKGTRLDEERALFVREIAKNVITQDKRMGITEYNLGFGKFGKFDVGTNQAVLVKIKLGEIEYSVIVGNRDGSSMNKHPDAIGIIKRYSNNFPFLRNEIATTDNGLDGLCDYGSLSTKEGLFKKAKTKTYRAKSREYPNGENLENKEEFQRFYEQALWEIAEFYGVRKKA